MAREGSVVAIIVLPSCALSRSKTWFQGIDLYYDCEAYSKAIHTQGGNAQPPITLLRVIIEYANYSEYHQW